ncbi:MAG: DMT family transporter [Oleispira sp.]|nr:DMT family transporter [Oleispira sp.]MBL4880011.1 DMT family transporter [Oleispira sp.]
MIYFLYSLSCNLVQNHSLKADLLLIIVTLLAAISWMFSKEAVNEMPPLFFIGSRFLLAGIFLALFSKRALTGLNPKQWLASAQVGVLFGMSMCLWIFGLFYAKNLGEGAFITSIASILVAPISYFIFKAKVESSNWIALPVAFIGLGLLGLENGFHPELSQLLFLGAAVLLSLTFTLNGRAAVRMPAAALTAISLTFVGIMALIISVCTETWPETITGSMMQWLLLSALIGTAARFLIQTYAQGLTTPSHAAVIMILEPIWTALIAAAWFDERMVGLQLLGCSLIFAALLINRWSNVRLWLKSKG